MQQQYQKIMKMRMRIHFQIRRHLMQQQSQKIMKMPMRTHFQINLTPKQTRVRRSSNGWKLKKEALLVIKSWKEDY